LGSAMYRIGVDRNRHQVMWPMCFAECELHRMIYQRFMSALAFLRKSGMLCALGIRHCQSRMVMASPGQGLAWPDHHCRLQSVVDSSLDTAPERHSDQKGEYPQRFRCFRLEGADQVLCLKHYSHCLVQDRQLPTRRQQEQPAASKP